MKRHSDALFISDGACNISGIALTLVDACREIRANPSTGTVASDPAIALIVSQIAYLAGIWDGISDWQSTSWTFELAREACKASVACDERQEVLAL